MFFDSAKMESVLRRCCVAFLLVFIVQGSMSFPQRRATFEQRAQGDNHPKGFGTAKYVVIIGIDGLGGTFLKDIVKEYPALHSFFTKGAHTTRARTVLPTSSGPAWTSILSGLEVNQHGIYYNNWTANTDGNPAGEDWGIAPSSGRGFPQTIFDVLKQHNKELTTGLFFTWPWFYNLVKDNHHIDKWLFGPSQVECYYFESGPACTNRKDWATQQAAVKAITDDKVTFCFIHLDSLDSAGHSSWFGSSRYNRMIYQKDVQIRGILRALENTKSKSGKQMIDETMVIVVSDHGGDNDSHVVEPLTPRKIYVPVLIRGPGVQSVNLDDPYLYSDVSTVDLAVTALNALGIEKTRYMRGRVLEEIYG